ncbi:MAG TPA: ABC transporter ATP-binding protein [Acidimicrobiales bacterium]|nr:ABC transporter ATP-binding protein [Acidimicrobiales bacterium]
MSAVIEARDVIKRWGATTALNRASLSVGRGVTGLLGANGAGKTTFLGLVLGMHRADGGSMSVLGMDPWSQGLEVRALIGYAPEHDALPPDVTAHDLVRHLAQIHGLPRREATARASDVLYELGLGEERFRQIGTMSTGQKQRVKLAQAIAHDPRLVLLDEPTNGLDPMQRDEMLALVRKVGHQLGIDVVLSSHLLDEVERVSDSVVILDAGRTVAGGTIGELETRAEAELVVEVDTGDVRRLVTALKKAGIAAIADGDRVIIALENERVYDVVRDALVAAHIGIRRLERRRTSLQDVYLAAGAAGAES